MSPWFYFYSFPFKLLVSFFSAPVFPADSNYFSISTFSPFPVSRFFSYFYFSGFLLRSMLIVFFVLIILTCSSVILIPISIIPVLLPLSLSPVPLLVYKLPDVRLTNGHSVDNFYAQFRVTFAGTFYARRVANSKFA